MSTLERAIEIAVAAHKGQADKGGNPYILHPLRVMNSLDTEQEMIVGVLHDVVEDCSDRGYTFDYLKSQGFSQSVLDALGSVSKTPEEEKVLKSLAGDERVEAYLRFVSRAKADPIGRRVKRADIEDNLDTSRLGELTSKDEFRLAQYKAALAFLDC